jgi:hypothetical protein
MFSRGGGATLLIVGDHRPRILAQPSDTLLDDFVRLEHFFHANQIAVIAVAVHTNRHIEINLVVGRVRLLLAQDPKQSRNHAAWHQ